MQQSMTRWLIKYVTLEYNPVGEMKWIYEMEDKIVAWFPEVNDYWPHTNKLRKV